MWQLFCATWVLASRAVRTSERSLDSRDIKLPKNEQVALLGMAPEEYILFQNPVEVHVVENCLIEETVLQYFFW